MRDFRDAKAMAHTLRSTLATRGHKITNSQSLEVIAKAFGAADWNTLAAAIRYAKTVLKLPGICRGRGNWPRRCSGPWPTQSNDVTSTRPSNIFCWR